MRQNVFKSIDPKTGRPDVDDSKKPGTGKTAEFCPSLWGGKDWPPIAFSPQTRLIYIPANENLCTELTGEEPKYVRGQRFMGVAKSVMKIVAGADHIGGCKPERRYRKEGGLPPRSSFNRGFRHRGRRCLPAA